jgi:fructosamine-3-kinase
MNAQAEAGARLMGGVLAGVRNLAGGDLSQIVRIRLTDGREAIVKNGPKPRAEAAMLRAIRDAGAPAPEVLGVDDDVLVLEVAADDGDLSAAWGDLGAVLARLHAASAPTYGWGEDYFFGSVAIENAYTDNWPRFWGERRILTSVPHVSAALARRLERLAARLPELLPARPPASLLHGDLWTGNVLTSGGKVSALIDPASYYGDGEVDIAMLNLFGAPSPAFYSAYGALDADWRERQPIYKLWPALVHLRLFGAGYRGMVEGFLAEAGC